MEVTEKMLTAALKKAVELELIPRYGFIDEVAVSHEKIKQNLKAAMAEVDQ